MDRKRTSVIWKISKEELQTLLDKSNSIASVLSSFGLNPVSGNHRTIHERIKIENLSLEELNKNRINFRKIHMEKITHGQIIPCEEVFIKDSKYNCNDHIKKRIIKHNLIPYKCSECGNEGKHNGKPLCLQLDHINGDSRDNRIENLRFICPNCHTQTATYAGKRNKKSKKYETTLEKEQRIKSCRKFDPTVKELRNDVENMNFCAIGRKYGVSDNAIRKRCRKYGLI